jgi:hypothetical protein
MANLSGIVKQLKKERDGVQRHLSALNAAITAFVNVYEADEPGRKRRKMSAKSRAKMAAAQRTRWARRTSQVTGAARPKRTMSAAGRRKIAAAQRARWARVRRENNKAA